MRLRGHGLSLVLLATAAVLIAGCGSGDSGSSSTASQGFQIEGRWRGVLHQQGLPQFNVGAEIRDLARPFASTVYYTGINCGGNWAFLGRSGTTYRFREVIDRGAGGNCKGMGIVQLTAQGADRLAYRFSGGGVESSGILARAG